MVKPSVEKTYSADLHESWHPHNVHMVDDTWFVALDRCLQSWLRQKVDPVVVAQLVSMASTFNSRDVLRKLERCSPEALPLQVCNTIPANEKLLRQWLLQLSKRGKPIFSIRFSAFLFN